MGQVRQCVCGGGAGAGKDSIGTEIGPWRNGASSNLWSEISLVGCALSKEPAATGYFQ